ncbi:MAG: calcium-translocating P-type ATPase, PMCA-type [Planctomycetes bacterium]|nr:calcium-translocating P-type ATPase, PMCA-type [Planctomycetota bacterium]
MRTLSDAIQQTNTHAETGLPEAAIETSGQQFGRNTLTPLPKEPLWKKFIEKFDEAIIKILLAAALLSMIVDLFKADTLTGGISFGVVAAVLAGLFAMRQGQWVPTFMFVSAILLFLVGLAAGHVLVEGLAVMVAVILATGVAFASEYKSDREFEVLNSQKDSIKAKAIRAGQIHSIPLEDVVVGDLILLETGDEIPADGRLLKATEFMVDQSLMTGESEPVRKLARPLDDTADGPEQPGCVYRGTQVVDGVAHLMVTEVGDHTYLGQIARRLSAEPEEEDEAEGKDTEEIRVKRKLTISKELTPLQQKLTHLADLISKVGYIAAVLIFAAQFVRGLLYGDIFWPANGEQVLTVLSELLGYFVTMVIIIVVAVPEGLPMSVTVSLALAMQKMTRANSLVRQLVACETIGSATVICSDKTGTLTQNKMRVDRVSWDEQTFDRDSPDWPKPQSGNKGKPIDWLALISGVNSTANLEEKQGKTVTLGNSTEGALLQWLRDGGVEYGELRLQNTALYQIHFSSERKRMTTVVRDGGKVFSLVKGAPEALLDSCVEYLDANGAARALNEDKKQAIRERLREAARKAMRTLAFAYAPLPADTPNDEDGLHARRDSFEQNLVYVGFVAIRDPLRDDVKAAIGECRDAGIEVKMVTGDNVETARAIGHEIGLIAQADEPIDVPGGVVFTSQRFNQMTDDELKQALPSLRILARARPLDKFRMVKLLQELGEVVAVTGDGTNDAPALKKADVGLAMGIAGTEVSKEASKIVLLDDAFSTIVKAVHWGRSLYENIQRFIQFQLTINVSALAITFLGILLFGVKAPFTVLQLLWINVIMDTFASIALCSEPPRPGVMKLPPKKRDENILTPAMVRTIFITAAFFIVVMLGLLIAMKQGLFRGEGSWSVEVAGTRLAVPQNADGLKQIEGDRWEFVDENGVTQSATVMFTVFQVSLFFSIYVFFQVWNQINARSLTPEMSGFHRVLENPTFLIIAGTIAVGQILIVTFGGNVFKVEALGPLEWLGVIAVTSTVLIFAEIARRLRNARA